MLSIRCRKKSVVTTLKHGMFLILDLSEYQQAPETPTGLILLSMLLKALFGSVPHQLIHEELTRGILLYCCDIIVLASSTSIVGIFSGHLQLSTTSVSVKSRYIQQQYLDGTNWHLGHASFRIITARYIIV